MAEIAFSVVGKLTKYTIDPILCQFKYMFCYKSEIQTLRDTVNGLEIKEYDVQQLVVEAERNAEDIKPSVKDWLQKVDGLKKQAYEVLESAKNSKMQCIFLTCPNLKARYSLGRKATKKTGEAAKLQVEGGTFQKVGKTKQLVQTPHQKPGDFGSFETRISTKKEIMEALKDKDVSIIGICGMPGVGKTTMAKEIANQVKVDKLFDEVAIAVVSQDQDVIKIQDELADMLGLKIKEKFNKIVRAGRLRERLGGDTSKSILVILDDVWECIELGSVGIPSAGDDKGLKILLTSRFEDVCSDIGAQRKFDINVLSEEESWELFKEKAEISDDETDVIKCTAEKVARECKGLPLALVTVGRALSKKAEHVWKNALEELQNSSVTNIRGVQKLVYSRIELSINYLESDEAKSFLLLFSLYPEDFNITIGGLVGHAWGLNLFRGTNTLSETRNRLNSIVDYLISCYLLILDDVFLKVHDVVRDVCLQIASKDKHVYFSKHRGLKEWPKDDDNESYSAIGLTSTELNQLPGGLKYPNLKFLAVTCKQQSLDISGDFFADMKELRVIDFNGMRIHIPSSIQLLTNLRTLYFDHCKLKFDISTIGNLKKLEFLSFGGSDLDHFPSAISELCNLRSLDLRLKHSCPLPPGILEKLTKLEELFMGVVEIRDDELEQRGYIIKEISSLTGLKYRFQMSTNDPHFLLQILHVLCIEKLERFDIVLAKLESPPKITVEDFYFKRRLHIGGITDESMLSQPAINLLMRRTDHLSIEMDMNNFDDLSLQVLERKNMSDEDGFEYLNGNHPTEAVDRLQMISLRGMPRMKHLWRGVIKPPSFHNLMILQIEDCPSVKSLFSESVALCMVNLQRLRIYNCEMLEEIFSMGTGQNEDTQMLEFPKLKIIILRNLRNFKSFRSGSNRLIGVHNPLFKQVTLPNLEKLSIAELGCTILFDFEYTKDDVEISILSQLTSLDVSFLPNLVHITRKFPKGNYIFENLTEVIVSNCENLSYLFSLSMANSLVALRYLLVSSCGALEEIIGRQEEDNSSNIEIVKEGTTSKIMFPKLSSLTLSCLDRFRLLSSQNYELVFPSLKYFRIEKCPVMTKFCSRQSAPKLDKVWINSGQNVDISNFMDSEGSIHI